MRARTAAITFALTAALLGLVSAAPTFGDADAYYHLWMAKRLLAFGPMRAFPWLPLTTLADHFADQHFLYHLALTPFVAALGDFWGLKIATVLLAAAAMTAFAFLLDSYEVRRPSLWLLPLLFAPGFLFRLLLTKATALALTALFLFLIALKKEKRVALFALAFAYVWLHAGWPLLVVAALVDACTRRSARFLPPIFLGLAAGLIINPFFPANLSFYWEQIVQVVLVGRRALGVVVGQEWYPTEIGDLIAGNAAAFLPLFAVAALAAYAVLRERRIDPRAVPEGRRRAIVFFSALAIVFLLMTLRQARHKEYFLPMLVAASALLGDAALSAVDLSGLKARVSRLGRFRRPLAALLAAALLAFAGHEALLVQGIEAGRPEWTRFAAAGEWMRAHLPPGAVVFQTAWDDTPYLLYRDDAQRYIAGLDPRFFSDKDIAKYWEWRDIGEGRRRAGLAELLERDFGARYVFLRRDQEPLRPLIEKDPSFERVYQDAEAEVWVSPPSSRSGR
jgi:hypothetical protein